MKISSAGAMEARIWKCRADGQPGFLKPLSFCLLSDSSIGRIWRIYGGTRTEGFLEISLPDMWRGADAIAGCAAEVFAQYSQGHGSRVLLSTCLLLCKRGDSVGRACSAASWYYLNVNLKAS